MGLQNLTEEMLELEGNDDGQLLQMIYEFVYCGEKKSFSHFSVEQTKWLQTQAGLSKIDGVRTLLGKN